MLDAKDDGATISAAMAKRFTTDHCFKSEEPRTVAARAPAHKIPAVANPSPAVSYAHLTGVSASPIVSSCARLRARMGLSRHCLRLRRSPMGNAIGIGFADERRSAAYATTRCKSSAATDT